MTGQTPSLPQAVLTDERILHLVDVHVGGPCPSYPLDNSDWINFARAVITEALSRMGGESVSAGWRDISTAPEGTMILCANMKAMEARDWAFVGWIAGGKICGHRMDMPTHWQPLPAAPTAPAQQAAPEEPALFHLRGHGDVTEEQLVALTTPAGQQAADVQGEPLLPHDVVVGGNTFRAGVKLSTFITAAQGWHLEAFPEGYELTAEQKAANLARLTAAAQSVPKDR